MPDLSNNEIAKIKAEIPIIIGNRIREMRTQKGLSQTELANMILSDRQYLYKIESGKVGISVVKLAVIAKALDIQLKEIFIHY